MTSSFDPATFLQQTYTEANDTERFLVPAGEYLAVIGSGEKDVVCRPWQKKDDPSVAGMGLDVLWEIQDDSVKQLAGRDTVKVKQGLMLDTNDTGLDFGKGKNVDLGLLRQAVDMNRPGQAFSFEGLKGRMAKVVVAHRADKNDSEKVYAEVKRVAKA